MTADPGADLPFVCIERNGGPYDDEAFIAGWQLGALDNLLALHGPPGTNDALPIEGIPVYPAALRQIAHIAIQYGCRMVIDDPLPEYPELAIVSIHRKDDDA